MSQLNPRTSGNEWDMDHTQECDDDRFMHHAATGDDLPCSCGADKRCICYKTAPSANAWCPIHGVDAVDEKGALD